MWACRPGNRQKGAVIEAPASCLQGVPSTPEQLFSLPRLTCCPVQASDLLQAAAHRIVRLLVGRGRRRWL